MSADLRAELRELRKKHPDHRSVSKMSVKDVAMAIGKLRGHLESTPSVANDGGGSKKAMKGTVKSVKEAKKEEFPVAPDGDHEVPKSAKKVPKAEKAPVAVKAEAKAEAPVVKAGRPAKGSEEAKAKMASIRGKKGSKKE
jgi:hypothetical protein